MSQTTAVVDYRALVSRADLCYQQLELEPEDGLPVGNGRMGSLVWTTPSALKLQINRVDVYPVASTTHSFVQRDTDYGLGCGFVDVDFVAGKDVFGSEHTRQHLSVYDALATVSGPGVEARTLAWVEKDVMAVEVDDRREQPAAININLRMLRPPEFRTNSHRAVSEVEVRDGRILLLQDFTEDEHYCGSAVVIGVSGRHGTGYVANEGEVRIALEPGEGSFTVLIASAASFDSEEDLAKKALEQLDAAEAKGFDSLLADNKTWWHELWSRSFVQLHSDDGVAEYVEENYTYFSYIMGASSRGKYPPRFGGMLWSTTGDHRSWGCQHWWNNAGFYYRGIMPTNRLELLDPVYDMYSGMYDASATAARQQWGSQGIFIPETVWFNGLEELPDDIAAEMRELYLFRKPWGEMSANFRAFADTKFPHSSRWNWKNRGAWEKGKWVYRDREQSPCGPVNHIFSGMARIAYLFWQRYEYSLDRTWLEERAYPMLRGAVEFYRNFPNLQKGEDGKYHIHRVNDFEGTQDAHDTMEELCGMRQLIPLVIRAAEILGLDAEMCPIWQEFADNLTPLPTSDLRDAFLSTGPGEPVVWSNAVKPVAVGEPRASLCPVMDFDLCSVETEQDDPEMFQLAQASFKWFYPDRINAETRLHCLARDAIAAAMLGHEQGIEFLVPNQVRVPHPDEDFCYFEASGGRGVLHNRLTFREGVNALGCQRLGIAATVLHISLCKSIPPAPGKESVIRLFAAWPKHWDATFRLLCHGGFLVSSSMQKGKIEFVEIAAQLGGRCRIYNPWPRHKVVLHRNRKAAEELDGEPLEFNALAGEEVSLVAAGTQPGKSGLEIPGRESEAAE